MRGTLMKSLILPMALLGLGLMPATSQATLTIALGNGSANNTLNYIEAQGTTGTIFHVGDNTFNPHTVMSVTVDQVGQIQGTGQNAVVAPNTTTLFKSVDMAFVTPYTGTNAFEANPSFANGTQFTVTGYDQFHNLVVDTFTIRNGQNRFNISTADMQIITEVTVSTDAPSIDGVGQIRVGNVYTITPEPSTLAAALSGLIPLGMLGLRRLRRRA